MKFLPIPTMIYAVYKIFSNYKKKIKSSAEISLVITSLLSALANFFFGDNLVAIFFQIILFSSIFVYIVEMYVERSKRKDKEN